MMIYRSPMSTNGFSPLAHCLHDQVHDVPKRTAPVFGIAVHQTGGDTPAKAIKLGIDPLEYAAAYYLKPDSYFAHYVVGYNGEIIQITDEFNKALHIGFQPEDRQSFLNGEWISKLPAELVTRWRSHWPNYKSPAHLFPGQSPNGVYVGIEMLPLVQNCGYTAAPWLVAGQFTDQQHYAVAELSIDIAKRQSLPAGWHLTSRLTTHEDINPLQRTTKHPPAGWDPGWLRQVPWFDLGWVRTYINDQVNTLNT